MAKIAVLNDYTLVLKALSEPLLEAQHQVLGETSPIDWERVMDFGPQVVVAGVSRSWEARHRAIQDVTTDVIGYKALQDMLAYPAVNTVPVILVGIGLDERELPIDISYDLYLYFPDEMDKYVSKVEEFATTVKKRRHISAYICPNPRCNSRLVSMREPIRDLFCPKCGSSVAIIDDEDCVWMGPEGTRYPCKVRDLLSPSALR